MSPLPSRPLPPIADDRRDARSLFDAMFSRIWLAMSRYGVRDQDRHDVAQDILLAALESWPSYDAARGEPAVWLNGIIRHHLLRYWERRTKDKQRFVSWDAEEGAPLPLDVTASKTPDALELVMLEEKRRLAHQLYQEIPFELLSVLIDHELDELTLKEVAERHGISVSTAHDRYNAALLRLQAALKRWEAKHRERGVLVLPLSLADLLDADRSVPDAPEGASAHGWDLFSRALSSPAGPGAAGRAQSAPDAPPAPAAQLSGMPQVAPPLGVTAPWPVIGALVIGLLGGAGIFAMATGRTSGAAVGPTALPAQDDRVPAAVAAASEASSVEPAPATSIASATPPRASAAASAGGARSGPSPMDSEALLREEALFDTARSAFVQGNMTGALSALEVHAREFPRGQYAPERDKMRIEALLAMGRTAEACKRAESFRRAYPKSAYLPALAKACTVKP
ncbi:MAG: RNA polymerase sigma factor [Byssovorax sp.]